MLRGAHFPNLKEVPVSEAYEGRQFVGMDPSRRRSVLVRMTESGQTLEAVGISNGVEYLGQVIAALRS